MLKNFFNSQKVLDEAHNLKKNRELSKAIEVLEEAINKTNDIRIINLLANCLLDIGNYQRIADLTQINSTNPRIYAIASSLANRNISGIEPICLNQPPLQKAAFITMVKDEEDIILFNLIWHYSLGFRKFFIIDNLSQDKTVERIHLFAKQYDDAEVFVLHDPIIAHYQGKKVTGACRFIMSLWSDLEWLALVDGDEFLYPSKPIDEILSSTEKNTQAIIVPKSIYSLVTGDLTNDDDFFYKRIQNRKPLSHISNKVIMRASLQFDVSQGNHRLLDDNGKEIKNYHYSNNLSFREFPIRSHNQYLNKIINGGQAVSKAKQAGFNEVGGSHWEAVYNLYLKEGEIGLRKHLDNIIRKKTTDACIADPFPIDKILNSMDPKNKAVLFDTNH